MKILIISDTHLPEFDTTAATISATAAAVGKPAANAFSFFPETLRQKIDEADIIVHAGDFESTDAFRAFESTGKLKAVHGNCDGSEIQKQLPERLVFEQNGFKFGVIHEAGISLNDNTARWYILKEMDVDILIYGHIHTPSIDEHDGKFLICPGSPTKARMSEPAVAEIILDDENEKTIKEIKIISVGQAACGYLRFQEELACRKENEQK